MLFVVSLLYKTTSHSDGTSHHIFHKTQLINFPSIEIEGHIRSCSISSRHKESPLFLPLNLFLVISSCLHWSCSQCDGQYLQLPRCLSSMQSAAFQGIHLSGAHLGLFLHQHSREKKAVQHTLTGNWGISSSQCSLVSKAGAESWP